MVSKVEAYAPQASYYSLYGGVTASGEVLDYDDWSAAHGRCRLAQRLQSAIVGAVRSGVTITDRGPAAWTGRELDLNMIVAEKIGLTYAGSGPVSYWVTGYDGAYFRHIS